MSTIKKFEDLTCWQKARELTKEIYKMFKDLKFKDYGLQDQLQRASVSIMSNIAEGFERGTRQEFLNYLFIAKGSAGEVRAQLYVALDAGYLNFETFKRLNGMVQECSKLISNFIQSLKVSKFNGLQFKAPKPGNTIPETVKDIIGDDLELAKYYDPRTRNINWGKYHEDKKQKRSQV